MVSGPRIVLTQDGTACSSYLGLWALAGRAGARHDDRLNRRNRREGVTGMRAIPDDELLARRHADDGDGQGVIAGVHVSPAP
jgi:hypothetical protein